MPPRPTPLEPHPPLPATVAFDQLREPFAAEAIEWKVIESGLFNDEPWVIVAPFLDARVIMERLDQVVGPANWATDIKAAPNSLDGVIYGLSLCIDGVWVTKFDGADAPEITKGKQADRTKSALTLGLRRASMLWGIGRYLWSLPKRMRATVNKSRTGLFVNYHVIKPKPGQQGNPVTVYWAPPSLPAWALPAAPIKRVEMPSDIERRQQEQARKAAETSALPTAPMECPVCYGPMADLRDEAALRNKSLVAEGKEPKTWPDFRCKFDTCKCVLYPQDYTAEHQITDAGRKRLKLSSPPFAR